MNRLYLLMGVGLSSFLILDAGIINGHAADIWGMRTVLLAVMA